MTELWGSLAYITIQEILGSPTLRGDSEILGKSIYVNFLVSTEAHFVS